MSEYTKGPWKINGLSNSGKNAYNVIGTRLGGKYKIARCPFTESHLDMEESYANATLIAAAPDLLEALQAIVKRVGKAPLNSNDNKLLEQAVHAINKATL